MTPDAGRPPSRGAVAVTAGQRNHSDRNPTPAELEVSQRVNACAVILAAISIGNWPMTVETLGYLVQLLEAAARWQMVVELELRLAA